MGGAYETEKTSDEDIEVQTVTNSAPSQTPKEEVKINAETDVRLGKTVPMAGNSIDPALIPNPKCIFLTGGTGFVGAFLLHELLDQTSAYIYCLVRAKNADMARERLLANLKRFDLPIDNTKASRIKALTGDLAQPSLGLNTGDFARLAETVDVIYHWLSLRQDSLGKTYHLTNPDIVNLNSFINFARSIGYVIDQIDFEPWLEAFLGTPDTKSQQGLSPYLNFYTIDQIMSLRLILNLPIRISDRATQVALETSGIACTPLDKRAMEAYFTYFIKTGFFPLPKGKQ